MEMIKTHVSISIVELVESKRKLEDEFVKLTKIFKFSKENPEKIIDISRELFKLEGMIEFIDELLLK